MAICRELYEATDHITVDREGQEELDERGNCVIKKGAFPGHQTARASMNRPFERLDDLLRRRNELNLEIGTRLGAAAASLALPFEPQRPVLTVSSADRVLARIAGPALGGAAPAASREAGTRRAH